jgi:hypothetical protein
VAAAAAPSFSSRVGGRLALAAAAGQCRAEPQASGTRVPARLQAPGLGHQGGSDPSVFRAASWGCARPPAPGIMGNGMTKVGGRGPRSPHLAARVPRATAPARRGRSGRR